MDIGRVKWVGLTGGIATGKTTASNYLKKKLIPVIDADEISHSLLIAGGLAVDKVVTKFGKLILDKDNSISRLKLGQIVFSDHSKLLQLNQIMHPLVRKKTEEIKNQLISKGHNVIINDIPLLFEKKLENQYSKTVLIYCNEETQIRRLKLRNNLSEKEIAARLKSQINIEVKKNMADIVVDNSGSLTQLYTKLDELLELI